MTIMTIIVMMMKDNVVTNDAGQACMFSYAWQVPISFYSRDSLQPWCLSTKQLGPGQVKGNM